MPRSFQIAPQRAPMALVDVRDVNISSTNRQPTVAVLARNIRDNVHAERRPPSISLNGLTVFIGRRRESRASLSQCWIGALVLHLFAPCPIFFFLSFLSFPLTSLVDVALTHIKIRLNISSAFSNLSALDPRNNDTR